MDYKLRTNSRIIAMMVLYNYDMNKELEYDKVIELVSNNSLEKVNNEENTISEDNNKTIAYDEEFLKTLVNGVIEKQDYIDYCISVCAEKYTLDAISFVDRSILRLGIYELLYIKTPKQIVINEMVNIAKEYSEIEGFKAGSFDNAILDKIANSGFKGE